MTLSVIADALPPLPKGEVDSEVLFENKQEPPPALAVHRRGFLFLGYCFGVRRNHVQGRRLRPRSLVVYSIPDFGTKVITFL